MTDFTKDEYLDIFIEHFIEFITDISSMFSNDNKIQLFKDSLILAATLTPTKCIVAWKNYVVDNFREQINNNDYNFFIENDWSNIINHAHRNIILSKINELRKTVCDLSISNKLKALKYVENLVKLCDLYNSKTTI